MIPDSRKLKRGLKDISPLFDDGGAPEPLMIETGLERFGFQLIGLFSPDRSANPLALSKYLVSQLLTRNHNASILSVKTALPAFSQDPRPAKGTASPEKCPETMIRWDKFQEICESSSRPVKPLHEMSHTLFLDFDYANPEQFQKIIPILDQWILLVKPEMEDLSEAYRMMKASTALNSRIEYFLLFDNISGDEQASRLFEKYGELVSRRLGIHLSWLGSLQLQNGKGPSARLALETLFMSGSSDSESVEKRAIAEFLFQAREGRT